MALILRALFQSFGGHEGVGDARWAGGDPDDLQSRRHWRNRCGRRGDAGERGGDYGSAGTDRRFGGGFIQRLGCEAGGIHPRISGDDDHGGGGNIGVGQGVSGSCRSLRFNLNLVSERFGGLLKSFRRHEGVRDAGGAGGDGN